jgi:hypothetical protein
MKKIILITIILLQFSNISSAQPIEQEDKIETSNTEEYSNELYVSCYPTKYNIKKGEQVSLSVTKYENYSYRWEGPGVYGMTSSVATVSYDTNGEKNIFVNVKSGDQERRINCGTVFVEDTPLYVSCRPDPSYIEKGGVINWVAQISGGDSSYDIKWKGHQEIRDKSDDNINIKYQKPGLYPADIEVTSGNQTRTIYCGSASVSDQYTSSIYGSCYPDKSYIGTNETIVWKADISGGKGNYSYNWRGTGNIDGKKRDKINIKYKTPGSKYAEVEACSDNECLDLKCGSISVSEKNKGNVSDYINLEGSCISNKTDILIGEEITWQANVNQEISSSLFVWNGTDNLNSLRGKKQVITYSTPGSKEGSFSVRTDTGELFTFTCPNKINVRPGDIDTGQTKHTGNTLRTSILVLLIVIWSLTTAIVIRRKITK